MPFFSPKTWKQRIVEFPGRRRLDDTSSADVYDVSRAEGTVTQEGDGFTAANMNDLEQRINNAVNDVAGLSADEYDPNATYSSGDLRIHDNILHKANQDISVAEPWTPDHWDPTTLAAELSAVNSRPQISSGTIEPNENQSFTGSIVVVICYANDTYCKIFGFRPGVVTTLAGDTSQITATADGNTYTISSSVSGISVRYMAFTA